MRILATKTTRPASAGGRLRFQNVIVPQDQTRTIEDGPLVTVGDVLHLQPVDCRRRRRWYKPSTGTGGIFADRCRRNDVCPTCAMYWLTDRIAAAHETWSGSASVDDDVILKGPDATPGAVSITCAKGRTVLAPGDELRGPELDLFLRSLLWDLPLERDSPRPGPRPRSDNYGFVPDRATPDRIRAAADAAGFLINYYRNANSWRFAEPVEPEQNRVFVEALWRPKR